MEVFPEIPGYEIIRELGEGGMGKIFLAIDLIFNRKVALKVLLPNHPSYQSNIERFQFEGDVLKKLNHVNIITVYDIGKSGETIYLSMEYLEGKSLKDKITLTRGKGLDKNLAIDIVKKISGALEYAHKKGVIHRDIKPENILFRDKNTPVLADFGIVKDFTADKSLTVTGTSMGTPYYMSPEQIKGYKPDERNDIYSLGVVFYEMLTGKVPYEASDIISIALKHEKDPVPSLPSKYSMFQIIIDRMMSKNRELRLRSGTEVIRLIDNCLEVKNAGSFQKKIRAKKRYWIKGFIIFLFIFFFPIISGYFFLNNIAVKKGSVIKIPEKNKNKKVLLINNKKKDVVQKKNIKIPTIEKPDFYLRRRFWKVNSEMLKNLLIKYNFYDSTLNKNGNFRNKYKTEVIGKNKVVIDKRTFLMWDQRGSYSSMSFHNAKKWIMKLNKRRFAGHNNWRLPTLEEAYSIVEKKLWYGNLHIFNVFSTLQQNIWTGDLTIGGKENWIIDFKKGRAKTPSFFKKKSFVRVVRRIK